MNEDAHHLLEAWRDDALDATQSARLGNLPRETLLADLRLTAALQSALASDDAAAFRRSLLMRLAAENDGAQFQCRLRRRLPRRRATRSPAKSSWPLAIAALVMIAVALVIWQQAGKTPAHAQKLPEIAQAPTTHAANTNVAQLTSGRVHFSDGRTIHAPAALVANTQVVCDETVIITLTLGATLTFAAGSHCHIAPAQQANVVGLEAGQVKAQVVHQAVGSALHIRTNQADVRVVGTTFQVAAQPTATEIAVREGRVAVTDRHTQSEQFVDPGQSLTIHEPTAEDAWRNLATTDLDIWNPLRGTWRSSNGELIGQSDAEGRTRIASMEAFGALRIRLEVQSDEAAQIELQVADYLVFATLAGDQARAWCALEATFRDGKLTATANGVALPIEAGISNGGRGPISLYARNGGLRIRKVTVQPLDATP